MRDAPAILILAAGASSRMRGADKLLEQIDGTPLILRAVRAARAEASEVIVALPAQDRARRAWLADMPVTLVDVDSRAMSASIRSGIAACRATAVLIHLADMPMIAAPEFRTLIEAWKSGKANILRATSADGRPGQPVIFSNRYFDELAALVGDTGAHQIIAREGADLVALPGDAALIDLDTPEDWAAWRAAHRRA